MRGHWVMYLPCGQRPTPVALPRGGVPMEYHRLPGRARKAASPATQFLRRQSSLDERSSPFAGPATDVEKIAQHHQNDSCDDD